MDEERIERALRDGPSGEPIYVPAPAVRRLERVGQLGTRVAHSRSSAVGLLRVGATVLVAILIVVALFAVRSASPSREPLPVASAPASSLAPASSPSLAVSAPPAASPTAISQTPSAEATPSDSLQSASPSVRGATGSAAAVAVGISHSCVLTTTGGVKCWGFNGGGQLGNGTNVKSAIPVDVVGLPSGVQAIAAASLYACALTTTGGVKCWGHNDYGQLGDGKYSDSNAPVDVVDLTRGIVAISVGDGHTCALTTAGGVKCWGGYCGCDNIGVLGNGLTEGSPTPVDVTGLTSGVTALAAGKNHTCALSGDGSVQCWGDNGKGQLGDGTTDNRVVPVRVVGLSNPVTAIAAAGDRTCAIDAGVVVCWGAGATRTAPAGTLASSSRPVAVAGIRAGVTTLGMGSLDSCVVDAIGAATCWGPNTHGQLGDGSRADRTTPVSVAGLAGPLIAIAVGETHACAVTTGGALECWGSNSLGESGSGVAVGIGSPTPVLVPGI